MFSIQGNVGLNVADEGYLWYGVDRVFHGEIPFRDFRSYDPGRYYWSALEFLLWRPGILPLRLSESLLQVLALFLGLLAARRFTQYRWELAAVGVALTLWMFPTYKYFDCAMPMMAVYVGIRLLEKPSSFRLWASGAFVGFSFWMGRNHGLYLSLAFLALVLWACRKTRGLQGKSVYGALGIFLGLTPFFLMCLWAKGFGAAYLAAVRTDLTIGTNIHLPVFASWESLYGLGFTLEGVAAFLFGTLLVILPFFYLFWIIKAFSPAKEPPAGKEFLLVCAVVGLPYLHHVYSRADWEHLAIGIPPFLLGCFAMNPLAGPRRWMGALLVVALSFLSIGVKSQVDQFLAHTPQSSLIKYPIGRDEMYLDLVTARFIENNRKIVRSLHPGETILFFPHLPALYPVFQLKSPLRNIYSLFPSSPEEQQKMIRELEENHTRWAVIDDDPIDGKEDLKFENTNPVLFAYLSGHFKLVPSPFLPSDCQLFHKPDNPGGGAEKGSNP